MISKTVIALILASWANAQENIWGQCGGIGWGGSKTCVSGTVCTYRNDWYSQCIPGGASSPTTTRSTGPASSTSTSTTTTATGNKRVGKVPALGWNSWNAYQGNINEDKILAAANQVISLGLKDAGYKYINVDDCWSNITGRDSSNRIKPDYTKFPNGISGLASKVHSLGLLFGIYSDAGTLTCVGYPGSLGYESIDAGTFSSWGVDYLKYDNCYVPSNWTDNSTYDDWSRSNTAQRYRQMGDALAVQTNPIFYSLCNWGQANVWTWGSSVGGQSWRMAGDSSATWAYFTSIIANNVQYLNYTGFYAHNDMDMMEIGNGDLTLEEQHTHFAMWAALKSPILLGTDLSRLSSTQLSVIKNKELLAFSQDEIVGAPAKPYGTATTTPPEYYSGKSSKGVHVFIMNTSSSSSTKTITFADVPGLRSGNYKIHDMWTSTDVGTFSTSWSTTLAAHDTGAWLITPV
ncbi:glycoside hydrolase [Serendipita vermifera]|nr:glycoside hydrolase [Serendipita vermifera]